MPRLCVSGDSVQSFDGRQEILRNFSIFCKAIQDTTADFDRRRRGRLDFFHAGQRKNQRTFLPQLAVNDLQVEKKRELFRNKPS
jgi:hypothetical protein